MYTVYLNSNDEGHSLDSFENKMIEICESHKNENRALAFAFLIYDFTNPNLWKVLNDREYWLALNEVSGEYLTVFSLNYKEKAKRRQSRSAFNGMQYMTAVNTSKNLTKATNSLTEKYFGNSNYSFPSILFFQINNQEITDSLIIELKEETVEQSFIELKDYIISATEALKRITEENRGNYNEIFNLLESSVEAKMANRKMKRVSKNFGSIIGLISSIKGLF